MNENQIPRTTPQNSTAYRTSRWLIAAVLSIALLTACSFGSTETVVREDAFTVGAGSTFKVVSENGKVDIRGDGANSTIQVTATIKNPERVSYTARQEGDTVIVTAEVDDGFSIFGGHAGARIEVVVPENIGLELETSNGSVSVTGVSGPVSVATSNGSIKIDNVNGDLNARTSNGAIDIRQVSGQVEAETSNGAVRLTAALREVDLRSRTKALLQKVRRPFLSTTINPLSILSTYRR